MITLDNMERKCSDAVGYLVRVRTNDNTCLRGVLVSARFRCWRQRGRSRVAQFDIVVKAGTLGLRQSLTVEKLPQHHNVEVRAVVPFPV